MRQINSGVPFNCTYCKRSGELSHFEQIQRYISDTQEHSAATITDKRRRRTATAYESLVPFKMKDGTTRELYTRLITKFNGEDVIL